jgi:hypothetical protein
MAQVVEFLPNKWEACSSNTVQPKTFLKMLVRMQGKKNLCTLVVGMLISATTMEISLEVLQKLKIELPYAHAILS